MSVRAVLDDSEFQRTLKKYLAVVPRELSYALNQKMFYIVRGAVTRLPKVEKSKIEQDMEVGSYDLQYSQRAEAKPRKVNARRAIAKAARNAKKQARAALKSAGKSLRSDARRFNKDIIRASKQLKRGASRRSKQFGKSTRRFGRRFSKKIRKAFR